MRHAHFRHLAIITFASFLALALAGCVNNKIDPANAERIFEQFSTGALRLQVGLGHVGNNIWFGERMWQAEQNQDWSSLAKLVIESDDGDDMGYFYLGRAAEGKGYVDAARQYYRLSIQATTGLGLLPQCPAGEYNKYCGGHILPRDAYARLSALQRQ